MLTRELGVLQLCTLCHYSSAKDTVKCDEGRVSLGDVTWKLMSMVSNMRKGEDDEECTKKYWLWFNYVHSALPPSVGRHTGKKRQSPLGGGLVWTNPPLTKRHSILWKWLNGSQILRISNFHCCHCLPLQMGNKQPISSLLKRQMTPKPQVCPGNLSQSCQLLVFLLSRFHPQTGWLFCSREKKIA